MAASRMYAAARTAGCARSLPSRDRAPAGLTSRHPGAASAAPPRNPAFCTTAGLYASYAARSLPGHADFAGAISGQQLMGFGQMQQTDRLFLETDKDELAPCLLEASSKTQEKIQAAGVDEKHPGQLQVVPRRGVTRAASASAGQVSRSSSPVTAITVWSGCRPTLTVKSFMVRPSIQGRARITAPQKGAVKRTAECRAQSSRTPLPLPGHRSDLIEGDAGSAKPDCCAKRPPTLAPPPTRLNTATHGKKRVSVG